MCNLCNIKCCVEGCSTEIYMHLGDYATEPEEIQVYCGTHVQRNPKPDEWPDLVVYQYPKKAWILIGSSSVGVNSLTENARKRWKNNAPNTASDEKIIYQGRNLK